MTDPTLDELHGLNDGYIRAVANSDAAWFDRHLSADFLNSNPDGSLSDRAAFLAQVARPLPLRDFRAEDVRIRLMGSFAIAHGRTAYRKPDGQAGGGRYTDVWAKQDGRWLCVCAHVTRG